MNENVATTEDRSQGGACGTCASEHDTQGLKPLRSVSAKSTTSAGGDHRSGCGGGGRKSVGKKEKECIAIYVNTQHYSRGNNNKEILIGRLRFLVGMGDGDSLGEAARLLTLLSVAAVVEKR